MKNRIEEDLDFTIGQAIPISEIYTEKISQRKQLIRDRLLRWEISDIYNEYRKSN